MMKALSLWRPWPWAIFHLPPSHAKGTENRDWIPWPSVLGQQIAIHAALTFDAEALDFIAARCPDDGPLPPLTQAGHPTGIIGVATIAGYRDSLDLYAYDRSTRSLKKHIAPRDPWFMGEYGWLLADVVALPEPVACKGAQGLWTVPEDIEARVLAQLTAAPRAA